MSETINGTSEERNAEYGQGRSRPVPLTLNLLFIHNQTLSINLEAQDAIAFVNSLNGTAPFVTLKTNTGVELINRNNVVRATLTEQKIEQGPIQ